MFWAKSSPPYAFMLWCLIKHKGDFIFILLVSRGVYLALMETVRWKNGRKGSGRDRYENVMSKAARNDWKPWEISVKPLRKPRFEPIPSQIHIHFCWASHTESAWIFIQSVQYSDFRMFVLLTDHGFISNFQSTRKKLLVYLSISSSLKKQSPSRTTVVWLTESQLWLRIEIMVHVKGKAKLSLCLTNETLRHKDVWGMDV
jgi:hypothetical protein